MPIACSSLKLFAVALVTATIGFLGQAAPAWAAAAQVRVQAPGFYRMMLGDFEITALLDGTHPFPAAEVLTKAKVGAPGVRLKLFQDYADEASALLAASDLTAPTGHFAYGLSRFQSPVCQKSKTSGHPRGLLHLAANLGLADRKSVV